MKTDVNSLAITLAAALEDYSEEVTESIKEEVKKTADSAVIELQETSPRGRSKKRPYRKGWRSDIAFESKNDLRIKIYNRNKPGLTHLLEFGHAKVNGGRVEGIPHIAPVEKKIKETLGGKIKARLK